MGENSFDNKRIFTRPLYQRKIDKEGLGYVEADQMKELLETHGTPFRAKEVDSFLSRAKDMETGRIYYEDYIAMMTQELEAMDL